MENGNIGKVSQVIGSTLDAQFPEDKLPAIYNALNVEVERTVLGETKMETLWCEVALHLGGGSVRAVALGSTDGMIRGSAIEDTGSPVTVPVVVRRTVSSAVTSGFGRTPDTRPPRPNTSDASTLKGPSYTPWKVTTRSILKKMLKSIQAILTAHLQNT